MEAMLLLVMERITVMLSWVLEHKLALELRLEPVPRQVQVLRQVPELRLALELKLEPVLRQALERKQALEHKLAQVSKTVRTTPSPNIKSMYLTNPQAKTQEQASHPPTARPEPEPEPAQITTDSSLSREPRQMDRLRLLSRELRLMDRLALAQV